MDAGPHCCAFATVDTGGDDAQVAKVQGLKSGDGVVGRTVIGDDDLEAETFAGEIRPTAAMVGMIRVASL